MATAKRAAPDELEDLLGLSLSEKLTPEHSARMEELFRDSEERERLTRPSPANFARMDHLRILGVSSGDDNGRTPVTYPLRG